MCTTQLSTCAIACGMQAATPTLIAQHQAPESGEHAADFDQQPALAFWQYARAAFMAPRVSPVTCVPLWKGRQNTLRPSTLAVRCCCR